MKLPEGPESNRAETVTEHAGVNSCTEIIESMEIIGSKRIVLTVGCGGLTGQAPMW